MALRRRSKPNIPANLLEGTAPCKERASYTKRRLSCVRCSEVVQPEYYMICKKNGHFLCGKCAWLMEPRPPHYKCCEPENLRKGPPGMLADLLNWTKWYCLYKGNGCEVTPKGLDWEGHVAKCIFKCDLHCFYKNCKGITHGVDETVHHYKDTHMLTELRTKESEIKLDLIYDRSEDGVKRRLTLLKDDTDSKYYIVGTEVTKQDFNIFIWDCSQRENYKLGETGRRYELLVLPFPGDKTNAIGQLTYNGMCQSMEKTPETIIENGDCISIGRSRLIKKYLGTYPGCPELDLCNIVVSLERKEAPKPQPLFPASDDKRQQEIDYVRTLFPSFPRQMRIQ